jgi:hypothetical protein
MAEAVQKYNPNHAEDGKFAYGEGAGTRFHDISQTPLPGTAGHASLNHVFGGEPKQRVEDVPLPEIHTTQQYVDLEKVRKMMANTDTIKKGSDPILIELGGKKYLLDGHHRLADHALRGERTMRSRVIWVAPPGTDSKGKTIKKADVDKRLVWGEVYAPNRPDVDGEYMTDEDVILLAHAFMRNLLQKSVDVQHDNKLVPGCTIVESFIARANDPDFIPGSWVICAHIDDDATWAKIKAGELNGFSVEALVVKEEGDVIVEVPEVVMGKTTEAQGHTHTFSLTYGPDLKLRGGSTDFVNGHNHRITGGTITEETDGHRHRFSSVDNLKVVAD